MGGPAPLLVAMPGADVTSVVLIALLPGCRPRQLPHTHRGPLQPPASLAQGGAAAISGGSDGAWALPIGALVLGLRHLGLGGYAPQVWGGGGAAGLGRPLTAAPNPYASPQRAAFSHLSAAPPSLAPPVSCCMGCDARAVTLSRGVHASRLLCRNAWPSSASWRPGSVPAASRRWTTRSGGAGQWLQVSPGQGCAAQAEQGLDEGMQYSAARQRMLRPHAAPFVARSWCHPPSAG